MTDQLLELLTTYGLLALAPVLAAAAIGMPLPASLLLLAAGAFAGGGQLSLPALLVGGVVAACVGDSLGYLLGARGGVEAAGRWGPRLGLGPDALQRAEASLARWGGIAIVLTRFLITPLGPVVNVVAGTARYPYRRFLLYDVIGETIWVVLYLGLGYFFGANWELLVDLLANATQALTLLVIVAALAFFLIRALRQRHQQDDDAAGVPLAADGTEPEGVGASALTDK